MPLARYFSFVGGALLMLLFILHAWLPEIPVADTENVNLPAIHIHSDRKWPSPVVYDTSIPTITPAQSANGEVRVPTPATVRDVSVDGKERQAFAQMQTSDARQVQLSDPKKREPQLQRQRKIARRHAAPLPYRAARQMQFGWFGNNIW
jgi:hypothetical protein